MKITLTHLSDFTPEVVDLILNEKLEGGYSIDYALNSLVSYHHGKEVIIYNFDKFFKLDNRWSGYKVEVFVSSIIINFK
jgi:hypothetical protein